MARKKKTGLDATVAAGVKVEDLKQEAVADVDQQTGQHAVPESGEAVPATAVVPVEEQPDAVSADPGEAETAGAGEPESADSVAAVEGAVLDMGTEAAEGKDADADDEEGDHVHADPEDGYPEKVRAATARRCGADAFLNAAHELGALHQLDGDEHEQEQFAEAAAFLLAHPDADADVIPVHLALKGIGGSMAPSEQDCMLWGVFTDTFRRVHRYLMASARTAEPPTPADGVRPAMQSAFKPQPGPFQPAGLSARG